MSDTAQETLPTTSTEFQQRKIIHLVLIIFATLIGGWFISGLIGERELRQLQTLAEFQNSWGPEQLLESPVLVVPYTIPGSTIRQYLEIAPQSLKTTTVLAPEQRKRGLFHATVYAADIAFQGSFVIPGSDAIRGIEKIFWEDSFVAVNTSALSGMTSGNHFTWDGNDGAWQNCRELVSQADCKVPSALAASLHLQGTPEPGKKFTFGGGLTLRGTSAFSQVFKGATIDASIKGPWPTPSFGGSLLPSRAIVTDEGFEGHWLSADYTSPRLWRSPFVIDDKPDGASIARVELLEATPIYRMIDRASKYSILFVTLGFTAYFLFELLTSTRIHAIQYGLLGVSLTLFALLLVSFSEIVGYTPGYLISSGLILTQASAYTAMVTKRAAYSALFAAMLAALFGILYVLLSLETYSLVLGSVVLFLAVSLLMGVTQRIKWILPTRLPAA